MCEGADTENRKIFRILELSLRFNGTFAARPVVFQKSKIFRHYKIFTMCYTLYYAPDNASLIIRIALLELGLPFETKLFDRTINQQKSENYLKLNPNKLIPVLHTDALFISETRAILLWLSDGHRALAVAFIDIIRAELLKWLFWISNTLHPALRILFYPHHYTTGETKLQREVVGKQKRTLVSHLYLINRALECEASSRKKNNLNMVHIYLAVCLRWMALYPLDETSWFCLNSWPTWLKLCQTLELRQSALEAALCEGLGEAVYSNPTLPDPPEGVPF